MIDLRFKDINAYMSEMSASIDQYLQQAGASPGVVSACTENLHKTKGLWDPAYLILNFWPSAKVFEEAYTSGESHLRLTKDLFITQQQKIYYCFGKVKLQNTISL